MAGELFEKISAGAISPDMPDCKAIVINLHNGEALFQSLSRLHSRMNYKVFVVYSTEKKLAQVLKKCREANLPAIVYGGNLDSIAATLPKTEFSLSMVSSGYCANDSDRAAIEDLIYLPNLDEFSYIGYQGYLTSSSFLNSLHDRYFQELRLGLLRENISLCEPMLRSCDRHLFDLNSLRYSDFPHAANGNPNGLYAEEACSVARYMGLSVKVSAVYLYGLTEVADNKVCNNLVAQIIWHICEGIQTNITENPYDSEQEGKFMRKIVNFGEKGDEIVFINSTTTDRWWMEVPASGNKNNKLIPCSFSDYKTACIGEVPMKWLFFYQKYSIL